MGGTVHSISAADRALVAIAADRAPALVAAEGERASYRFLEFFTTNIRYPHTRRAYARARRWNSSTGFTRTA